VDRHGAHEHLGIAGGFAAVVGAGVWKTLKCGLDEEIGTPSIASVTEGIEKAPTERDVAGLCSTKQGCYGLGDVGSAAAQEFGDALICEFTFFVSSV
jgi:hypothetical protein